MVSDRMRRPTNLLIAAWSSAFVALNSCAASVPALDGDCRDVVGPHVPIDELFGRLLTCAGAWRHVLIVEDDDVDGGKRPAIRLRVADTGRPSSTNALSLLDRNFDVGERVDLLWLAVLEHLETVPREFEMKLPFSSVTTTSTST